MCFVWPHRVGRPIRFRNRFVLAVSVFGALAGNNLPAQQEFPPEIAAEFAKTPPELPPNHKVGIDIDRFIGNSFQSAVRKSHATIFVRSILTPGDPYQPGEPGAVLEYRNDLAEATLLGRNRTPLVEMPDQIVLFITGGEGRLDNGGEYWDLKERTGVLIPPGAKHRLASTSDAPLRMIMVKWTPAEGASPAKTILVRDLDVLPFEACGADLCHWSYMGKTVFSGAAHGLHPNEGFFFVSVAPMSMGGPHAHVPSWEEVWIKLPPHDSYMMLGSELREMPPHTAFLAPPNYKTTHSVINTSKDQVQTWLLTARFIIELPEITKDLLVPPTPLE